MPQSVPISDEVSEFLDRNGYEPVELRRAVSTDEICVGIGPELKIDTHSEGFPRLIVRKKWQPGPLTLKPGWIWCNNGIDWYWSNMEPGRFGSNYCHAGGSRVLNLNAAPFNFTPPDWPGQPVAYRIP